MKGRTASPLGWGWALGAAVALVAVLGIALGCGRQSGEEDAVRALAITVTPKPSATATLPPRTPTATPMPPTATPAPPTATPEPPTPTPEPPTPTPPPPPPPPPTEAPPPPPEPAPETEAPPAPPPPPAAGIDIVPPEIGQGGVAVVRAGAGAAAGAEATFLGRRFPLLLQDGLAWGVLGVEAFQEPGAYPVSVELLAADGSVVTAYEATLVVVDVAFPVEYITLPPDRAALLDPAIVQEEINRRAAIFSVFTPQRLWSGPFLLPVAGTIGGGYGVGRSYNDAPVIDFHHGTDIVADAGVPVAASNSGRVAFAGALDVRGDTVIVDHGLGVFSAYHHLSQINVVEGQEVTKGDVVGAVGDTGLATGPHLHWEIIVGGVNVDPLPWTAAEVGP